MSDVTVEQGKKGFLTLKYKDRYIHSTIDPEKESERMLPDSFESNIYIVLGLGLGYHLKALLSKLGRRSCTVFVFEEKQEIIDAYMKHNKIDDFRILIFKNSNLYQFISFFQKNIHLSDIQNPCFIELKSETLLFREEYGFIKQKIDEFFRYYFQSLFTEAEFGHLWYKNFLVNSGKIFAPQVSVYLEGTAILVSAGPSLTGNIGLLKKLKKKLPVIVVDTALKTLLENDIIPEAVISTDAQIHNYYDFLHLQQKEKILLCCDITTYYKIPLMFDRVFFFRTENAGDELFEFFNRYDNLSIPCFPGGGSVSSSAMALLYYFGASKVILFGQDLCYPNVTHAVGTIHYDRAVYDSEKIRTVWDFFNRIIQLRGHRDLFMENLSRWLEDFIELTRMECYQVAPVYKLKNSISGLPDEFFGQLHQFQKPFTRKSDNSKTILNEFRNYIIQLRQTGDFDDFMKLRNHEAYRNILTRLFLKQELYLNRKNGDKNLFLGGCYRILDRIVRAMNIALFQGER